MIALWGRGLEEGGGGEKGNIFQPDHTAASDMEINSGLKILHRDVKESARCTKYSRPNWLPSLRGKPTTHILPKNGHTFIHVVILSLLILLYARVYRDGKYVYKSPSENRIYTYRHHKILHMQCYIRAARIINNVEFFLHYVSSRVLQIFFVYLNIYNTYQINITLLL